MTQEDIDNVVLELKYGRESPSKALAFTKSREERDRVSEVRKLCQKWSNGKPVDGNPLSCSILNLPSGEER